MQRIRRLVYAVIFAALLSPSISFSAEITDNFPPSSFCDRGAVVINGKKFSFIDLQVEGNGIYEIAGGAEVTAYGYVMLVDIPKESFEKPRAKIFGGDRCFKNAKRVAIEDLDSALDMVFVLDESPEKSKNTKRILLGSSERYQGKQLVKITGKFELYSNTLDVYLLARAIEVID